MKNVTNPSPASSKDFFLCRLLSCSLPEFLVTDNIWLANSKDSSEAGLGKCLDSLHGGDSCSPGFCSIQQNRLQSGIANPDLDVGGQI